MPAPAASKNPYEAPRADAPTTEAPPASRPAPLWLTSLWVSTTYFAEGLPYMIVRWLAQVYATAIGLPEGPIGALNAFAFAWTFKFTWAPLLDWIGTKRGWLVKIQLAFAALCGVLAALVHFGPPEVPGKKSIPWESYRSMIEPHTGLSQATIIITIIVVLSFLAVLAATNDVAIDAYYIAGLPGKTDQAAYSGLRTSAYRIAVIFAKLALVGVGTWAFGFAVGALVLGALALVHAVMLPQFEVEQPPHERPALRSHILKALLSFLDQPRIVLVLAFLVTYKLGDEILLAMKSTFLLRELKLTIPQFRFISAWIETPTLIGGTMLGAWLLKRYGLRAMAMPLTLVMVMSTWGVAWLAWARPDPTTSRGLWQIWLLHGYEQLALGLGLSAFTLFIIYTCKPAFKAAHFAIGTAISSLGSATLGSASGVIVEHMGYTKLYIIAFVCSLPAVFMLPFLPLPGAEARR